MANESSPPVLPASSAVQPGWVYRDPSGRFTCELHRVYAPPKHSKPAFGLRVGQLDEKRSYWTIIHFGPDGERRSYLSFEDAKKRQKNLIFRDFSSFHDVPALAPVLIDGKSR